LSFRVGPCPGGRVPVQPPADLCVGSGGEERSLRCAYRRRFHRCRESSGACVFAPQKPHVALQPVARSPGTPTHPCACTRYPHTVATSSRSTPRVSAGAPERRNPRPASARSEPWGCGCDTPMRVMPRTHLPIHTNPMSQRWPWHAIPTSIQKSYAGGRCCLMRRTAPMCRNPRRVFHQGRRAIKRLVHRGCVRGRATTRLR
jgi:hypothetical protein